MPNRARLAAGGASTWIDGAQALGGGAGQSAAGGLGGAQLGALLDQVPQLAVSGCGRERRVIFWNRASERLYGFSASQARGRKLEELIVPPAARRQTARQLDAARLRGLGLAATETLRQRRDGTRVLVLTRYVRLPNQAGDWELFCLELDLTHSKRLEEEQQRVHRALLLFGTCQDVLFNATSEPELLNKICQLIVKLGGKRLAWVGYVEMDRPKTVRPVAQAGRDNGYVRQLRITWADAPRGRGPVGMAIRTARTALCVDTHTDPRFAPFRREALAHGYGSVLALPLRAGGAPLGALTIYEQATEAFNAAEVTLLQALADELAFAIRTLRLRQSLERTAFALQERDERFQQMADNIQEVFWMSRLDLRQVFYVSPAYETVWGRACQSLYANPRSWLQSIHPDDRARVHRAFFQPRPLRAPLQAEYRIVRPDGSIRWIWDRASIVQDERGRPRRLVGVARDITQRKLLEQQLLDVSEHEQRRIGQDLHDSVGQQLTAISYLVSSLKATLREANRPELSEVEHVAELLNDTIAEVRGLARGLHPVKAVEQGLQSALEELAGTISAAHHVQCRFAQSHQPVLVNDAPAATNLYRIAQEAVRNAVVHGRPRQITIRLHRRRRKVELTVANDGRPWRQLAADAMGLGQQIMQYRAAAIGATLTVQRGRTGGTVVRCQWPDSQPFNQAG